MIFGVIFFENFQKRENQLHYSNNCEAGIFKKSL